jgi:hypothetical protein
MPPLYPSAVALSDSDGRTMNTLRVLIASVMMKYHQSTYGTLMEFCHCIDRTYRLVPMIGLTYGRCLIP